MERWKSLEKTASENIHLNLGSFGTRRRTRNSSREIRWITFSHFKKTQRGMMRKLKVTSGLLQEKSFVVITLYPESNCTCRKKNHVLLRWSTSTLPEQHIHHSTECWKNRLKITGMWMEMVRGETCKETKTSRPDDVWPDMWELLSDAAKKKAKQRWTIEKLARQCQTIERNILLWTKRRRIQAHNESRSEKVGNSNASSNALQNTDKEQWRNPPQYWETQDKIRLCCSCRRKHETKARRSWTQTSSRSHHCKRDEFYNSL